MTYYDIIEKTSKGDCVTVCNVHFMQTATGKLYHTHATNRHAFSGFIRDELDFNIQMRNEGVLHFIKRA